MVISHNMMAANASRMYNITTSSQSKTTEKLSSGYRINRAADDAAGLSISEKMRRQIRGLSRASDNAEDGISLVQTADGALEEVHSMLQRANELSVQAANGTNSENDRSDLQDEISKIKEEINRIGDTTSFNSINLFKGVGNNNASSTQSSDVLFSIIEDNLIDSQNKIFGEDFPEDCNEAFRINANLEDGTYDITDYIKVNSATQGVTDNSSVLAKKIATELLPNAISQITNSLPILKDAANFQIDLYLKDIDGYGDTSALAGCWARFTSDDFEAYDFYFEVDTSDFSDSDATSNSGKAGYLESTIAHEMTHSLMQNKFTTEMFNESGLTSNTKDEDFPTWFKEGSAQLTGGGMNYVQGWNNWLADLTAGLTGENDSSKDLEIQRQLTSYTVEDRVYGNGYLAMAYLSHIVASNNGNSDITSSALASGFNQILTKIDGGKKLSEVIQEATGTDMASFLSGFNSGTISGEIEFVRKLAYNSQGGSGSIIADALNVGGTDLLGSSVKPSDINVTIDMVYETIDYEPEAIQLSAANKIAFHVGADADMTNKIAVNLYEMNSDSIGLENLDVSTEDSATDSITYCESAIQCISRIRSYYGAIQNRLEHTVMNLDNVVENTEAAESRIRDTNMAEEMVTYSKNNILAQAGEAMLAQANSMTEGVLSLLE